MTKKYHIVATRSKVGEFYVEAENEDEARKKAEEHVFIHGLAHTDTVTHDGLSTEIDVREFKLEEETYI